MEELRQEANEMKLKYHSTRKEYTKMESDLKVKNEECGNLKSELEQMESKYQLQQSQYAQLQELYKQTKNNEQYLREELDESKAKLDDLAKPLTDAMKQDSQKMDAKMLRIKQHLVAKQTKDAEKCLDELSRDIARVMQQLSEMEAKVQTLEKEVEDVTRDRDQFKQGLQNAAKEVKRLKSERIDRDEVQSQLKALLKEIEERDQMIKEMTADALRKENEYEMQIKQHLLQEENYQREMLLMQIQVIRHNYSSQTS
ncbi:hypothetical protein RFI_06272 [Reticulomyxa filosa]|uniref:Viral A-type inclusion protein n=1 Tax=Reticulomyxa filosa TaxID=46433 RepID=X6NZX5_RETFI|nr:hypothetical protein RFI_06272 [Reticulomyxa filosa]|eukprot:ETO30847.1 hypothetical protein RFI_06272 [Reticulomyxa filosa]